MELCFIQATWQHLCLILHCITVLYRTCLDMVADEQQSSSQPCQEKDFEGGVHLGIGGFNLVSALFDLKIILHSDYLNIKIIHSHRHIW